MSDKERRIEIEGDDEDDILGKDSPEDSEEYEQYEEEEMIDEDSPEAVAEALARADEEANKGGEWEISDDELDDLDAHHFIETEKQKEAASQQELKELNDKYVRLYAEFDNYRKRVAKDKEELGNYVREEMAYELLPSLDHLDIALKHAGDDKKSAGLKQGVEMTLRELHRTLEKFGLKIIEAEGKPFDPVYHHAVAQVETNEVEDKTVVEEMRRGYMFGDKVLRAAMVSVSRRPGDKTADKDETEENENE